jgi:hypothetical protein
LCFRFYSAVIITVVVNNAMANASTFTLADWIWQVAVAGLLGLVVTTALPAVALQQFRQRRARNRNACPPAGAADTIHNPA